MRGDRPFTGEDYQIWYEFTPHARGSTHQNPHHKEAKSVYPACAGIDPVKETKSLLAERLPRMRGDRPRYQK